MDTSEFQRLNDIKQLGGCSYVYPSASHSRKEHSIGVAYLAKEMVEYLQKEQPDLGISQDDIQCVSLAGLVHDIGHGPYSHMFEEFVERVDRKDEHCKHPHWEHEVISGELLKLLITKNKINLNAYFSSDSGITGEEHLNFVEQLINGLKDNEPWPERNGRTEDKRFLFDIVSNSRNGIDVDKLDYLVRDAMATLGSTKALDIDRVIKNIRVVGKEICFQLKVANDINAVYTLRASLHRSVYQHRIANVAEAMITDLLEEADSAGYVFRGADGKKTTLSKAARNVENFVLLTDAIVSNMVTSPLPGLEKAREIASRLNKREFYKSVGNAEEIPTLPKCDKCHEQTQIDHKYCLNCGHELKDRHHVLKKGNIAVPTATEISTEQATKEILALCNPQLEENERKNVLVHFVTIHHGKKTFKVDHWRQKWETYDPVANVGFYNPKADEDKKVSMTREKIGKMFVPDVSFHRTAYCILRNEDTEGRVRRIVEEAWKKWAQQELKGGTSMDGTQNTPKQSPAKARAQPNKSLRMIALDPVVEGQGH